MSPLERHDPAGDGLRRRLGSLRRLRRALARPGLRRALRQTLRIGRAAVLALGLILALVVGSIAHRRARLRAPVASWMVRDRDGRFLGEIACPGLPADHPDCAELGWWPVDELPGRVVDATLVIEDRRFWQHPGVDPASVGRAVWQNLSNRRRISGASTVPMQVARMQNPAPRTWPNKILEASTALLLVQRYGRRAVMAHYLRLAPYAHRARGIRYAARFYFDKPVADLSWAEIALLTAIPQSPARHDPTTSRGLERAAERGRRILDGLVEVGRISPAEAEAARAELARLRPVPARQRPSETLHTLLDLPRRLGPEAGPEIELSLDLPLQREIQYALAARVDAWRAQGAGNAAAMVVDRRSGEVLASVGSTNWFDRRAAGAIDFTRVPRSPGSTLKPLLYALALDQDLITPDSVLDDVAPGADGIVNADRQGLGPMLPRQALAASRNLPAVEVVRRLGPTRAAQALRALGLGPGDGTLGDYGLGLAVGAMPVTLEQLITATLGLASDGHERALSWSARTPSPHGRSFVSSNSARQVAGWLADPMARLPVFPRMGHTEFDRPVSLKTGTSSGLRDAWTVAWDESLVVAVWLGHPDHQPMRGLTGYRGAAPLVRDTFEIAAHRGITAQAAHPEGHAAHALCARSGGAAHAGCSRVSEEWLPADSHPTPCRWHDHGGQEYLPARYTAWLGGARRAGEGSEAVALQIAWPPDGLAVVRDPDTPPELATLALRATVDPPVEQVVWYVDDEPFAVVGAPYTARWPLDGGEHRFSVGLPFSDERSPAVRVLLQ